jgi:hypothetical protein
MVFMFWVDAVRRRRIRSSWSIKIPGFLGELSVFLVLVELLVIVIKTFLV